MYFRRSSFKRTVNRPHVGGLILTASILLLALVALLQVVVLTFSLLTTHILNKKLNSFDQKCLSQLGSGFSQAQSSD